MAGGGIGKLNCQYQEYIDWRTDGRWGQFARVIKTETERKCKGYGVLPPAQTILAVLQVLYFPGTLSPDLLEPKYQEVIEK